MDIYIEVKPGHPLVEGHNIDREVKARLMDQVDSLNSVLVHVEPYLSGTRSKRISGRVSGLFLI